ncbi:MAG: DUF4097 family beta strand repeat-containing protein [Planctomycetota bacterium]
MKPQPPVKPASGNPILMTFALLAGIPLFLGFVLMVSGCQFTFGGTMFSYTGEKFDRAEAGELAESVESVAVVNKYGNVSVTAGSEVGWSWALTTWGDDKEIAEQFSDEITLEVSELDGVQRFELVLPSELTDCNGIKSHLTLTIPESFKADLDNAHGNTDVTGVDGWLVINSAHGDIRVTSCAGNKIDSRHGDVEISSVAQTSVHSRHGDVKIKDASGDVECDVQHGEVRVDGAAALIVNNAHGEIYGSGISGNVEIDARHGDIDIKCSGESIFVDSAHGDVGVTVESMELRNVNIDNAHGDITLRIPEEMLVNVKASASHGDVVCDFVSTEDADVMVVLDTSHDDVHVRKHTITLPASEAAPSASE